MVKANTEIHKKRADRRVGGESGLTQRVFNTMGGKSQLVSIIEHLSFEFCVTYD